MACNCISTNPPVLAPSTLCDDCLTVESKIISCVDAPNPCGVMDTVELAITNCDGAKTYTVTSFEEAFTAAGLADGPEGATLSFTTADPATSGHEVNKYYAINYYVTCDATGLSAQGCVLVCSPNLCSGVACPEGQECDPCDGTCVVSSPNIVVS